MWLIDVLVLFTAVFTTASLARADDPSLVWRVTIDGNAAVRTSEIEKAISTTASSFLRVWPFKTDNTLDPIAFAADRKRIEHLYRRRGYYKATVDRAEVSACSKPGRVCVLFHIVEREPTRISQINIQIANSRPPIDKSEVMPEFAMLPGEIFDHDRYLAQKKAVIAHLKGNSYAFADVKGEAQYDLEHNTIALSLLVVPGAAVKLGLISFEGLDQIRPEDAMARLPIKTGERYDPRQFEDSETLLASLDVFRSIELELKPRSSDDSTVDVVYHVKEKQLRTLLGGGGVRLENSRQEARLIGEWKNRNFYHHLRTLDVRGEPKYAVVPSVFRPEEHGPLGTFQISTQEPSFLSPWQDLNTAIGFDADLEQGFRWYGPRFSTELSRFVTRQITVSGGYSFRYLRFYQLNFGSAPNASLVPPALLFNKNYRLGFIDQRATWDRRDQPGEPHRGFWTQMRLEESFPMLASAFTYATLRPEVRGYLPMTERATFSVRALYGRLLPLSGSDSPITERFYEGGADNHRGFGYHRLSPQVTAADGSLVPVGGNVQFLATLEPRIRLFTLGDRWMLGALFLDVGDVVSSETDLDFRNLHYALGTGLRYDTIIGIVRADVGFRLNRLSDETNGQPNPDPGSRVAFHVSIGEAF